MNRINLLLGTILFFRNPVRHSPYDLLQSMVAPRFRGKRVTTVYDMIHEKYRICLAAIANSAMKKLCVESSDEVICICRKPRTI